MATTKAMEMTGINGLGTCIIGATVVVASAALPFGVGLLVLTVVVAAAGLGAGVVMGGLRAVMGRSAHFGWHPAESYLSGKKGRKS